MSAPRPKILAIDDTPANLMVLARALAGDYTIQLADSGLAGLAMAQASPPDLILLDVMMPEVDGLETCRRLKADPTLAAIPVIFITALTDSGVEVDGLALGAADFLHKPVNVAIAGQRIRNLLEREALRRQVERNSEQLEALVELRTRALSDANQALQQAKQAVEAANRVKTAFLANMGHELRTPLNAILGMAELLKRPTEPVLLQERVSKIENAGRLLLSIINDILYLTRSESEPVPLQAEPFTVDWLIQACTNRFQHAAGDKGLQLNFERAPNLPAGFLGAPARLKQALDLLLDNAIKYSERGAVTLRLEPVEAAPGQPFAVRFAVLDQGEGIPAGELQRLFDPFTQADESLQRRHGGIGVGLAICKHLVHMLGGELVAASEPGRGSCFSFVVPCQPAAVATSPEALAPAAATPVDSGSASCRPATPVLLAQVHSLMALLRVDDIEARTAWTAIAPALLPCLGENGARLQAAIDNFAFDTALEILEGWLAETSQP